MSAFQPRVVIMGAGFAELSAAKAPRRVPVQVTVVDQHDYHTFKPFLYQVATALLVRAELTSRGIVFALARVKQDLLDDLQALRAFPASRRRGPCPVAGPGTGDGATVRPPSIR